MAGVAAAQNLEGEDDSMLDASLLSVEQGGSRLESALASPGDPMDISPLPAANHQHGHVVGQQQQGQQENQTQTQMGGPSSQSADQFSEWVPGGFCTRPLLSKYQQSASSGPLSHGNSVGSMGLKTRSSAIRSPNRFSPKDKDIAALRKRQLNRLPLAVQTKLPTPHKPFPSLQGPKNSMSGGHLFRNQFVANESSAVPLSGISRSHARPYQFNNPSFKPRPLSNAFATGTRNDDRNYNGIGGTSGQVASETSGVTSQNGDGASRGGSRKRPFEEEEEQERNNAGPSSFVSPSYRKFIDPALPSAANETRQENGPYASPQRQNVAAPTTSTLISPLKPSTTTANNPSASTADNSQNSVAWNEMRELDQVFRDQGIYPLQEDPSSEPQSPKDLFQEPTQEFKTYRMPGAWPDEDLLYFPGFPGFPAEEPKMPVLQGPGLVGDHSLLMSATPDISPAPAATAATAQNAVNAANATSLQGVDVPSASSQDLESSQSQGPEATLEQQLKNSIVRPPMSLYDQLHRIYTNSWEATHSVVTAAISLAGTFKRHAVALFEARPPRSTSHTRSTSTSPARASPARANVRALPEDQRRRLKSNQWRIDRGFPTAQNYPFPNLSFEAPPTTPSSSARLRHIKSSQKPVTPKTKDTKSHGASSTKTTRGQISKSRTQKKPSKVQPLSPDIQRRLRLRPTKRKSLDGRRNRSLAHAYRSGKLTLDDVPGRNTRLVTAQQAKALARSKLRATQKDPVLKSILRKPSTEVDSAKRTARRRVRFTPDTAAGDDPSLVGTYLHPAFPKPVDETSSEDKENEAPKRRINTAHDREGPDNDLQAWLQSDFPFGRPVSAVRLFTPGRALPPGRTESIYAAEWRKIEEEERKKAALESPEALGRIRPSGPAVRPLSENWEAKVAELQSLPSTRQVATTLAGDPLLKKDVVTCYQPVAWLNDEMINSYLAVLIDYLRRKHNNAGRNDKPKFHAFNSFFFSNLRDKGYTSVRRWAQRAKIGGESLLNVDMVLIPVHDSAHWTLMVVSPTSKTIEYFDSLGEPTARHIGKVKEWLKGELAARYVEDEWTAVPCVSPQQNNGSDCGVFLLSTAKAVAIGLEPQSYGAKDIPLLRRKIVAELMAGGLSGEFDPVDKMGDVLM